MVDMQQQEPQAEGGQPPRPQPSQNSGCGTGLKLLGAGCLTLIVVGIIVGIIVVKNFKKLAANAARMVVVSTIEESGLPIDQQKGLTEQVDRVVEAYKDGEITIEQVGVIGERMLPLLIVWAAEAKYIKPSALTDEEKADGKLQLQRFARGMAEEKINEKDLEEVTNAISEPDPANGEMQPKEKLTDDEVRTFIADLKTRADAVEIPNEAYEVDPVAEMKAAVDEVLAEGAAPAAEE